MRVSSVLGVWNKPNKPATRRQRAGLLRPDMYRTTPYRAPAPPGLHRLFSGRPAGTLWPTTAFLFLAETSVPRLRRITCPYACLCRNPATSGKYDRASDRPYAPSKNTRSHEDVQRTRARPESHKPGMGRIPGLVPNIAEYVPFSAGNPITWQK
jgi:hypothetical protein